jgi:competence ComEA-like helix-hairpin-helix protein
MHISVIVAKITKQTRYHIRSPEMSFTRTLALVLALLVSLGASFSLFAEEKKIDINTADAETIAEVMEGVGSKKAQAIVADRNAHGAFLTVDDLMRVKGIGQKIVEQNRLKLTAGQATH